MEGDLQRVVGRNLRAYRQAQGLSQEAFAEVVGVHRTYMGGLERGERNLTLKSVERIAARIDINPLALMQIPQTVDAFWPKDVDVSLAPAPPKPDDVRRPGS
jgi:transcriptional regulator with XRE-family HTH domain